MPGNGVSVDPGELVSCSSALDQTLAEAASGLRAACADAESAGTGFPADLASPFAAVNEYFARADSVIQRHLETASARVLAASESYCSTESSNAERLAEAADGVR